MNIIGGLEKFHKTQQLGMQDHNNNQRKHCPLKPMWNTLKKHNQERKRELLLNGKVGTTHHNPNQGGIVFCLGF
jgi:hypothetical protein